MVWTVLAVDDASAPREKIHCKTQLLVLILTLSTSKAGKKQVKVQSFQLRDPPLLIFQTERVWIQLSFLQGFKHQSLLWHAICRDNVSVIILWPRGTFVDCKILYFEFRRYVLNELTLCGRAECAVPFYW